MLKTLFKLVGLAVVALVAVVVTKTLMFTSKQIQVQPVTISVDTQALVQRLSQSVTFPTISPEDLKQFDPKPFAAFHQFLQKSYPKVHQHLKREVVNEYSVLYTWTGSDTKLTPYLLMGHLDVVPVAPGTEKDWKYPPFSGKIADGAIWGRGTLDDKCAVLGILEAVEYLLQKGYKPQRTVYLAFGHDEEISGKRGAQAIAALLKQRGTKLAYVLDEGMVITRGIVPGIKQPTALIGLAEKGYLTLQLAVKEVGGHSSMPPKQTAIGVLSSAIHRLEQHRLPARLQNPTTQMFTYLGPEMAFGMKMVFANLWFFRPLVARILAAKPSTNATIRTTTAVTLFQGGIKDNVLPIHAKATVNFRILPGDTIESVVAHVRQAIKDSRVHVSILHPEFSKNPSPVSPTHTDSFNTIQRTIREVFPGTIVAPNLVLGGTDSRHFSDLSQNVYRFLPLSLTSSDLDRIHGTNERITIENYTDIVRFFIRLIQNSNR